MLFLGNQGVTSSVKGATSLYIGSNFIGPMKQVVNNKKPYYNWKSLGELSHKTSPIFTYTFNNKTYTNVIRTVCYGNGMYVALLKNNNALIYSYDGENWTQTLTAPELKTFDDQTMSDYKMFYYNNKFYICGFKYIYTDDPANDYCLYSVAYSSDLVNWTIHKSENHYDMCGIRYINNQFVSCGNYHVNISTDLINWTTYQLNITGKYAKPEDGLCTDRIIYGNGIYIIYVDMDTAAHSYFYSTDLINWVKYTNTVYGKIINYCRFLNGKFVFFNADYVNEIYISEDGINWTKRDLNFSMSGVYCNGVSDNVLYIFSYLDDGYAIYYTSDLENWKSYTNFNIQLYNFEFMAVPHGVIPVPSSTYASLGKVYIFTTDDNLCYTLTETPDTSSVVFSEPGTASQLSITSVGQSSITLSDEKVYDRNSAGDTIA